MTPPPTAKERKSKQKPKTTQRVFSLTPAGKKWAEAISPAPSKEAAKPLSDEPRGSLSMFPDLWMSHEEDEIWKSLRAKETIKAERVEREGWSDTERIAYRLGVDEGLWFVAIPRIKATIDSDREAVRQKIEAVHSSWVGLWQTGEFKQTIVRFPRPVVEIFKEKIDALAAESKILSSPQADRGES